MKQKMQKLYVTTGVMLILFLIFVIGVEHVDVASIGPEGSSVGFATINKAVQESLGVNMSWYQITNGIGFGAILVAAGFAMTGFIQLVKRKRIGKVDKNLFCLAGFYVLVVGMYILFEKVIINYRPILMEGELEASFPSSHTMLVICIFVTAIDQWKLYIHRRAYRLGVDLVASILIILTIVGRILSGVHWFTDILGGILLSSVLILFYYVIMGKIASNRDDRFKSGGKRKSYFRK
ncbi:phosphatase PAP2 family protein [Anaerosporobacter faecicola]|uniref:phosphatase PAP2 family protein n=1 Tax=Anaerosporobacter faecicola TaxID=2718714 RepID=UPI00143C4031|nr:phosphatase PAP2 family protein [Anaerosporobacter faecicola]